jgi:histidine ammonia-lyase
MAARRSRVDGNDGGIKLRKIVELAELVVAIELIAAAQGLGTDYLCNQEQARGKLATLCAAMWRRSPAIGRCLKVEQLAQVLREGDFDALL